MYSREDFVTTTLIARTPRGDSRPDSGSTSIVEMVTDHADQTKIKSRLSASPRDGSELSLREIESEIYAVPTSDGEAIRRVSPEKVVISAEEMCGKITLKENGLYARLDFWNGSTLQRRFTSDGDFTVHYIREDLTLELNSRGEAKFFPRSALLKSPEEVYEFNWLMGTMRTTDSSNTTFLINKDGSYEISKLPLSESLPTKRPLTALKDGHLVASLLRSEWTPDDSIPRNPPRLFIIEEDGSGMELMRDLDMIPYLRRESNNPQTTIVEEKLEEDPGAVGVSVVTKVDALEDGVKLKDSVITYRMLTRYPPMTKATRRQLLAEMSQYREWQAEKEERSDRLLNI
ncbi:Sperm-associated antigen 17 [Dinochytrium kinnereticum]|nr:Sperm-associated antigen 17 [Dinochytrium kinnereticum]